MNGFKQHSSELALTRHVPPMVAISLLLISVIAIPELASWIANLVPRDLIAIDTEEVFLWISIHHLVQLGLAIAVMAAISNGALSHWGLNTKNMRISLVYIGYFVVIFGAIELFRLWGIDNTDQVETNVISMIGIQAFQYLLSGLCEEPLFRGLVIVLLATALAPVNLSDNVRALCLVGLSTIVFMLAHVQFEWTTMTLAEIDWDQQLKAFQFGILYAVLFIATKSLLAPIIIHGLSNGIQYTLLFHVL